MALVWVKFLAIVHSFIHSVAAYTPAWKVSRVLENSQKKKPSSGCSRIIGGEVGNWSVLFACGGSLMRHLAL